MTTTTLRWHRARTGGLYATHDGLRYYAERAGRRWALRAYRVDTLSGVEHVPPGSTPVLTDYHDLRALACATAAAYAAEPERDPARPHLSRYARAVERAYTQEDA